MIDAIRVAASGHALLDPLVTHRVIAPALARTATASTDPPGLDQLTSREVEVMHMLARGMSNAEIAAALVVGDATVKTHVARIRMKLQLRDRVQVVIYAYEHGLIQAGSR